MRQQGFNSSRIAVACTCTSSAQFRSNVRSALATGETQARTDVFYLSRQDGSIKWSSHAIASAYVAKGYFIEATWVQDDLTSSKSGIKVYHSESTSSIEIDTGKVRVTFPIDGSNVIQSIANANGKCIGSNGRLVLLSRSDNELNSEFQSHIEDVVIEQDGPIRAVVVIRGNHRVINPTSSHPPWLPFTLRFYLYHNSEVIRLIHTIVYDGDPYKDFIHGIGIRLDVPLGDEPPYNRHVRLAAVDGSIFSEAVQGITGLRRDPGIAVRQDQINGRPTPPLHTWNEDVGSFMKWVPCWNDYSISQLSPDGYTMKKRTAEGYSWVNIPSGTRAGGLAYLGSASCGGLGIGMRHFWERFPTGLDVRNANGETGQITLWLYNPSAAPMDLRPYHDGLQQETYDEQLDALRITYEDWEECTGTPYGIARTNEINIFAFDQTPAAEGLAQLTRYMRDPPILVSDREHILQTQVLGTYWSTIKSDINMTPAERDISKHLDFLFDYYQTQISDRRWYGFWDHGDIMHTYDENRHMWRYDIGGYAWDNSELSPDLFFWLYFLRTGKYNVYRLAEAMTRHTSEVDAYHIGQWKGLGTRHGVQHWGDSCKQARVSSAIYKRIFYYLTGGDERTGELLDETLHVDNTLLVLDPYRKVRQDKVYVPSADAVSISLGTDWSAFAAAWFVAVERRITGWEETLEKLRASMKGIGRLRNGFVTGMALYNIHTGEVSAPPQDPENEGAVQVSHLSAMFGLFEISTELIGTIENIPEFRKSWLDYCFYFNADEVDQEHRYGRSFGSLILRQGHSRLTAYAATMMNDAGLAKRAWKEFYTGDGYGPDLPWTSELLTGSQVPFPVHEASWVSTNISALYGLAAIQNLALIGQHLAAHLEGNINRNTRRK